MATDPTLSTVNDIPCTTFSLASDTKAKDTSGNYMPIFYRVTVWRRLAENVAKYLHKGDPVTVQGDLSLRTYMDRDGRERTSVQITASHVEFPARRNSVSPAEASSPAPTDDGLPF